MDPHRAVVTGSAVPSSNLRADKRFSLLHTRPDRTRDPSLLYNGQRGSFSGVKRPRGGFDHPPHHPALRLEMDRATPPLPHLCIMECYADTFQSITRLILIYKRFLWLSIEFLHCSYEFQTWTSLFNNTEEVHAGHTNPRSELTSRIVCTLTINTVFTSQGLVPIKPDESTPSPSTIVTNIQSSTEQAHSSLYHFFSSV